LKNCVETTIFQSAICVGASQIALMGRRKIIFANFSSPHRVNAPEKRLRMSEYINNNEQRKNTIKSILKKLHEGKSISEVKEEFEKTFDGVMASEISLVEAELIAEGLPVEEIQNLCDVHAEVFKGSIEEIHMDKDVRLILGHPVNTIIRENRAITKLIKNEVETSLEDKDGLLKNLEKLQFIDNHYLKKENLIFPIMEKHDITAPPKVMWGVDDDIRKELKNIINDVKREIINKDEILELIQKIKDMIFKEENIMIPMILEEFKEDEWKLIADESFELGFIIQDVPKYNSNISQKENSNEKSMENPIEKDGLINLPSGKLTVEELTCMLNTLPFDITFVDKDDLVAYFTEGKERAFPRTRAIIGRNVSNCHPSKSVHIVEQIVEDFKSGKKDNEDFWIKMGEKYVLIRYFAVRNSDNEYIGVIEVTQDIKPIKEISGEKRLMS